MRLMMIILLSSLLGGCAAGPRLAEPIQTMPDHPRLVYRSLVPEGPTGEGCPAPAVPPDEEARAALFIPFPPDRWNVSPGDTRWQAVYQQLNPDQPYAVVGRATANEAGAALVAQRRATVVSQLFIEAGFPASHVQTVASWGPAADDDRSGVMILELASDRGLWGWPRTVHYAPPQTKKGG